ncbi:MULTISPECIES: DUF952 domain-containing protein [Pseudovibrio]|uniref:DUF952 domain-containing protein n=1 Tax=Stappiaceae TaxID=2821832 RepID=UPI00236538FC|nr:MULTISPECIES: DUF952 domain-containing protein [Pseudovibrio]MDD7911136.1 DUF952 domain-containing protein [Pseudovibrio exalbescens]MDX5593176.1 DUF952 domain-containing protein [Pseudovibrio sp. SPO723]
MSLIYKIAEKDLWHAAEDAGVFVGAPIDLEDGFIHYSTADTVKETAAKHFKNKDDLLLIAIESDRLPEEHLKWEPSRGGALFPHLYAPMQMDAVVWVKPLPLVEGTHQFPEDV